jgi:2'-5' RNA ligase
MKVSRPDDSAPAATDDERWRCFVAVDVAEPARTAIAGYLGELRATCPGVGWTRPENLHLTLAFLGDVAASRIASLSESLAARLGGIAAFTARAVGLGAFPSLARPQVLWVGIAAAELGPLADAVQDTCERAGFPRERRAFRPHVTLGRVRARRADGNSDLALLARDGDRDFGAAAVARVILYRSELGRGGARHTALASFALAGPARFS